MHDRMRSVAGMPTKHWRLLDDGRVQCDVCLRAWAVTVKVVPSTGMLQSAGTAGRVRVAR